MVIPGRGSGVTRTFTALVGGALAFVTSTAISLLFGRDRGTAVKFGVVAGGSTAVATWLATAGDRAPAPREDPIRIEIDD